MLLRSTDRPAVEAHDQLQTAGSNWLVWVLFTSFASFIFWVIWTVDSGQGDQIRDLVGALPYGDKVGHFCLMGTLALLLNAALRGSRVRVLNWQVLHGSAWVAVLVTIEEASQILIASRTFDLGDLVADFVGIWLSGVVVRRWIRVKLLGQKARGNSAREVKSK